MSVFGRDGFACKSWMMSDVWSYGITGMDLSSFRWCESCVSSVCEYCVSHCHSTLTPQSTIASTVYVHRLLDQHTSSALVQFEIVPESNWMSV